MDLLRKIALVVLGISSLVFIALFGRLPAFRKTPIGFLNRAFCIYIPRGLANVDILLCGGRLSSCWNETGRYVLYENHPLILIFFISLQVGGEWVFVPSAWPRVSAIHHFCILAVILLPYLFLYASVVTKSFVTHENHAEELRRYPFDRILFHPGKNCSTCHFLKPARSKHCSICKTCVSRHDHHCIWLMNCVGLHNYRYFLGLLLSVSILLIYGSYLGYSLLKQTLHEISTAGLRSSMHWHSIEGWKLWFNVWAVTIATDIRIGAVYLLALMTAPLALGFLIYHIYLIWAGTTTNESAKWSDWKDDVADGYVYKSTKASIYGGSTFPDSLRDCHPTWPARSDQILILTDGKAPPQGFKLSSILNEIVYPEDGTDAPADPRWVQLRSLREVENIYDLGFWNNLRDALDFPIGNHTAHQTLKTC